MLRRAIAAALVGLVALAAIGPALPALAIPSAAPVLSNVEIANVSDYGFTITWVTNELANGYVRYGTSDTQLSLQAYDVRGAGYIGYTHHVNVTSLVAVQTYWFAVTSGDTTSSAQSIRTGPSLGQPPVAGTLYGVVKQNDGQTAAAGALAQVYVQRGSLRSAKQAALAGEDGRFQIDLALARAEDNNSFFSPVGGDVVRYQVNGGPQNLLPYDGPSGAQRFEMQQVIDGDDLPDVILPNASLPTVTPARSSTPTRTRTATAAATAAGARTPTTGPTSAPAAPSATVASAATALPAPTMVPVVAQPSPTVPPAAPSQPLPVAPPSQPIAQATVQSAPATVSLPTARAAATATALLRPAQPIDPAARATRTALAALISQAPAQQPTPPAPRTTAVSTASLTTADAESDGWMSYGVRLVILLASLTLAIGLGLVTMQVVKEVRRRNQRNY